MYFGKLDSEPLAEISPLQRQDFDGAQEFEATEGFAITILSL